MPATGPARPQARFCTAIAKAKVSRVQPRSWVIGPSHKPKPWRMPIDSVTTSAPHSRTWCIDSRAGVPEGEGVAVFMAGHCSEIHELRPSPA